GGRARRPRLRRARGARELHQGRHRPHAGRGRRLRDGALRRGPDARGRAAHGGTRGDRSGVRGSGSRARRRAPDRCARRPLDVIRLRGRERGPAPGTRMTRGAVTGAAAVPGSELDGALRVLPEAIRTRAVRAERVTQLALAASGLALERAGRAAPDDAPRPGHGIVLGTAFGCFLTNAAYQRRIAMEGVRVASPRLFAATVSNAAAGEIGIAYRLGGPAVTVSAGAAAGLVAIGHAMDLVASG